MRKRGYGCGLKEEKCASDEVEHVYERQYVMRLTSPFLPSMPVVCAASCVFGVSVHASWKRVSQMTGVEKSQASSGCDREKAPQSDWCANEHT